jgi:hypothetical protein
MRAVRKTSLPPVRGAEAGQVLTEYAALLAMFVAVSAVLILLVAVFTEYGWRVVSLVSLEYP